MQQLRRASIATVVAAAACAGTVVRQFGDYTSFSPKVTAPNDQPRPKTISVQLAKPANVAVFVVTPGRAPVLLFPADSTQSTYIDAGTHELSTTFAKPATASDTSRLVRRPTAGEPTSPSRGGIGQRSARDSAMATNMERRYASTSYLLVYTSEEPLSYQALSTKVQGLTIPAEDDEALNTVTKLIHATQQGTGAWAAWATEM